MFGDADGVVIFPREIAFEVLERAEEIQSIDLTVRTCIDDVEESMKPIIDEGGYL